MDLENGLISGDKRSAARIITLLENGNKEAYDIVRRLYPFENHAKIIGITGAPGTGKSTLTDRLVKLVRSTGKKAGIIAIDPSSRITGGAILGDRIRMSDLNTDPGVFIRSMSTRGIMGGLSRAALDTVRVLEILGMDFIFIETAGVGQSETDIVQCAEMVVVIVIPGAGDEVQAMKAGIMEAGDIFVINKSDLAGCDRTFHEIESALNHRAKKLFRPQVIKISALENSGIDDLWKAIEQFYSFLRSCGELEKRKKTQIKNEILSIVRDTIMQSIETQYKKDSLLEEMVSEILLGSRDPYSAARDLLFEVMHDIQQ